MDQYNWYQVKYNADNEVMNVEPASKALILNEDYVLNIDNLEAAINGKEDTVLYMESFSKDQPEMKGSTLFMPPASPLAGLLRGGGCQHHSDPDCEEQAGRPPLRPSDG